MESEVFLPPDLARAARALTKVSAKVVGDAAGLTKKQVRAFEDGADLSSEEKARLKAALERYGVTFIPEGEVEGYGVRRKFSRTKLMKIDRWEGEGGQIV